MPEKAFFHIITVFSGVTSALTVVVITLCFVLLRLKGGLSPSSCSLVKALGKIAGNVYHDKAKMSSLAVSLGGTIGAGNIIGVASAIRYGGRGTVLWLVVGALLGMTVKYAEVKLALSHTVKRPDNTTTGGAMYVASHIKGTHNPLSVTFCLATILCAFVMGNITQSTAIIGEADAKRTSAVGIFCAVSLCAVIALLFYGRAEAVFKVSSFLVPVMGVLYIGGALIVIIANAHKVPAVCLNVLASAFDAFSANSISKAFAPVALGFSAGLVSNEAGLGSSPIAHARSGDKNGEYMGIIEVFFSSIVVGLVTALAVMCADTDASPSVPVQSMVTAAFSSALGTAGEIVVHLSIVLFAFTSIASWFYYAGESSEYLWGKNSVAKGRMSAAFCLAPLAGLFFTTDTAVSLSQVACFFMCLSNLAIVVPTYLRQASDHEKEKRRADGKTLRIHMESAGDSMR